MNSKATHIETPKTFARMSTVVNNSAKNEKLELFKQMLTVIEKQNGVNYFENGQIKINLLYRNSPDGTPRWIWPAGMSKPVFLKFYNTSNLKAKVLAFVIQLLFAFKLQRVFASGKIIRCIDFKDYSDFIKIAGSNWALFTGTAGLNRSAIFYGNNCFYKIAVGENAQQLLEQEYYHINALSDYQFSTLQMPIANMGSGVLKQTDIGINGKRIANLTDVHWQALNELSDLKNCSNSIGILPDWKETEVKLEKLVFTEDSRLPKGLIKKLVQLKHLIDPSKVIKVSFSHGDFTPWNMFVNHQKLAVIDWELAVASMPCLFDAFHFVYQQASLVDHISYRQIEQRLNESFAHPLASNIIADNDIDLELHHQLYLLFTVVYYLDLYSKQSSWHPQVKMSMGCWSEAINSLLDKAGIATDRQLMLSDIFDFLSDQKYAALKWLSASPTDLSEDSDIDICIERPGGKVLKDFLRKHPFCKKLEEKKKSFMSTFSVILTDDSFISIDSIYVFKRRDLIMLDASKLLASSSPNAYGVKIPSVEMDFSYMWLFYLLNNSSVPERYQQHYNFFSLAWRRKLNESFTWKELLSLRDYHEVYQFKPLYKRIVQAELLKTPANKGISKFFNKINYYMDTVKESIFKKGFIVTFSGVDGAGKSTVIENVSVQIEKKFRRKVVVLRHRPSLLPMISGLKEGRKASELRSASTMPRQGNNSSVVSSLFRFSYYYADYLFGQFVIQVKYIWRGYIVVYDRYYFDFINDGKRSNIVLPSNFTKFWYTFLIKPSFNFFLYADPETILQRKKEMDGDTIRELTNKYLDLFDSLSKQYHSSKYISIRNEVLPETLEIILQQVKQKAL